MESISRNSLILLVITAIVALTLGGVLGGNLNPRIVTSTRTRILPPLTTTTTLIQTRTLTSTLTTTETVERTRTETVTRTIEAKTSTQASTQTQPVSNNEAYSTICIFSDYSGTSQVKMNVLKVVRGESAKDAVMYANMFNKQAPDGYEYILVNVKVTLLDGEKFSVNPLYFKVESKGRLTGPEFIVYPKNMPELEVAELLPGGSVSGWLAFIIPKGASAWLHMEPLLEESEVPCQVSLGS